MSKPWLNHYTEKTRHEIPAPPYDSLAHLITETNKKFGQRPSFTCMGKTLSFMELENHIESFAKYLQHRLGIKKGDAIAIMLPNILQFPIALFAAHRVGAIVVNVNPLYTPRELEHQLKDSGAKAIIILENFANTLVQASHEVQMEHVIVTKFVDLFDFPKKQIVNLVLRHVKKVIPPYSLPGSVKFSDCLNQGIGLPTLKPVSLKPEDIAFLQYTGGTTGASKGAVLTHLNVMTNVAQSREVFSDAIGPDNEMIVTALPLYHIFSLVCNCLMYMTEGGLNILIPNPRDLQSFIKELGQWPFTAVSGVNTLFNNLLQQEEFHKLDFSHLRLSIGGGMAVQKPVADHWQKVTGNIINQAYGLTETSPAVTINPINLKEFNGTIGLPIPNTDVCIKDSEGNTLPFGEPGELCVKGPQVMKGYWNKEKETKEIFDREGWLHTGDIATLSEQGFVTIVDRKKDMIIVSGFNVYPNEIEEIVVSLEGVVEAAAIGVEDASTGEAVKLFVVASDKAINEDAIRKHCQRNLVNYKRPKHIQFVKELPKTPVGKILRRMLKTA